MVQVQQSHLKTTWFCRHSCCPRCVGAASEQRIHGMSVFLQARHHIDCLRYAESRCSRWDSCIILHVWFAECVYYSFILYCLWFTRSSLCPSFQNCRWWWPQECWISTTCANVHSSDWIFSLMMPANVSWWWGLMGYLHCRQEAFRWGHDFPFLRIPACISLATLSNHGIPNCKKKHHHHNHQQQQVCEPRKPLCRWPIKLFDECAFSQA